MHRRELSAADVAAVQRFVARRVGNSADAADIAQQTLLLACANLSTFRGEDLSAWMFMIARHLIVDHFRVRSRFQFVQITALAETEPAVQTSPDAALERRERLRGWLDCITHRLRLEEQVAVLLADIYEYRDKDSAAALCMSVPSFKLMLHETRARLHEIAGANGTPVKKMGAAACDESANGNGSKNARPGNGGRPSIPATHRVGVICRLGARNLLALRGSLVAGLNLLFLILEVVPKDLDWLDNIVSLVS